MKELRFVLLFLLITFSFYGCENKSIDEYDIDNQFSQDKFISKMQQPVFDNFINAFNAFISVTQEINSKKRSEDLNELLELQALCTEKPDEYLFRLESVMNSIYAVDELETMSKLHDRLQKAGALLSQNGNYRAFSDHETKAFHTILSEEMLTVNMEPFLMNNHNKLKTKSESDCKSLCNESYQSDLIAIAAASICSIGGSVIVICSSLGTMSIPALISAILSVAGTSIAIDKATMDYNICLKSC